MTNRVYLFALPSETPLDVYLFDIDPHFDKVTLIGKHSVPHEEFILLGGITHTLENDVIEIEQMFGEGGIKEHIYSYDGILISSESIGNSQYLNIKDIDKYKKQMINNLDLL